MVLLLSLSAFLFLLLWNDRAIPLSYLVSTCAKVGRSGRSFHWRSKDIHTTRYTAQRRKAETGCKILRPGLIPLSAFYRVRIH